MKWTATTDRHRPTHGSDSPNLVIKTRMNETSTETQERMNIGWTRSSTSTTEQCSPKYACVSGGWEWRWIDRSIVRNGRRRSSHQGTEAGDQEPQHGAFLLGVCRVSPHWCFRCAQRFQTRFGTLRDWLLLSFSPLLEAIFVCGYRSSHFIMLSR